jgi:hypothetical protein
MVESPSESKLSGTKACMGSGLRAAEIPRFEKKLSNCCFSQCRALVKVTFEPDSLMESVCPGVPDNCFSDLQIFGLQTHVEILCQHSR